MFRLFYVFLIFEYNIWTKEVPWKTMDKDEYYCNGWLKFVYFIYLILLEFISFISIVQ
jgi:hypothetical protein